MPIPPLPTLTVSPTLPRSVDVLVVGLAESGIRGLPEGVQRDFRKRYGVGVADMAASLGACSVNGAASCAATYWPRISNPSEVR